MDLDPRAWVLIPQGLRMPPHPHIFSGILPNPCYTHYNVEFDIEVLAGSASPLYLQSLPRCIQR
jgi:hypothetical protein